MYVCLFLLLCWRILNKVYKSFTKEFLFFMQISYYGLSCFRIASKPAGRATEDVVLYLDPVSEKGLRAVYGKTDIVLCSQGEGTCSADMVKGDGMTFDFPGEYSVRGIDVVAIDAFGKEKVNTIFVVKTEEVRIAHLGRLRENLTEKQLEALGEVDVLLLPVGGGEFIDAKVAAEIARKIEPKIVIPMMYDLPGIPYTLEEVKKFLGEMGSDGGKGVDKWVFKKKDIAEKSLEVVVLTSQR